MGEDRIEIQMNGNPVKGGPLIVEMIDAVNAGWAPSGAGAGFEWLKSCSTGWLDMLLSLNEDEGNDESGAMVMGAALVAWGWENESDTHRVTLDEIGDAISYLVSVAHLERWRRDGLVDYRTSGSLFDGSEDEKIEVRLTAKGRADAESRLACVARAMMQGEA